MDEPSPSSGLRPAPGFAWTERQFIGGAVCLDLANTVVYPADPGNARDRIATPADFARWCAQAARHHPGVTAPAAGAGELDGVHRLRRAVDRLFRPSPEGPGGTALPDLLEACQSALKNTPMRYKQNGLSLRESAGPAAVLALSALRLAMSAEAGAVKAGAACDWLFVDRSRGRRRKWCDMETCGNRAKAARHYRRHSQNPSLRRQDAAS